MRVTDFKALTMYRRSRCNLCVLFLISFMIKFLVFCHDTDVTDEYDYYSDEEKSGYV